MLHKMSAEDIEKFWQNAHKRVSGMYNANDDDVHRDGSVLLWQRISISKLLESS